MIRRPPSAIPLRQSDVEELEAFLAKKRESKQKDSTMQETGEGNTAGKQDKGKGKEEVPISHEDSIMVAEEQARQGREGLTREQRIGL